VLQTEVAKMSRITGASPASTTRRIELITIHLIESLALTLTTDFTQGMKNIPGKDVAWSTAT
jgi:hypothetical protein